MHQNIEKTSRHAFHLVISSARDMRVHISRCAFPSGISPHLPFLVLPRTMGQAPGNFFFPLSPPFRIARYRDRADDTIRIRRRAGSLQYGPVIRIPIARRRRETPEESALHLGGDCTCNLRCSRLIWQRCVGAGLTGVAARFSGLKERSPRSGDFAKQHYKAAFGERAVSAIRSTFIGHYT